MSSIQDPLNRRSRRSLPALVLVAAVAVVAAAGAQRALTAWRGRASPVAGALWIWAPGGPWETRPRAFYAVRDFELESPPRQARLLVLGDEEYVVRLNGRRVGSNVYRSGAPLDLYSVARLLVPGTNRLVVELRSERGQGGLLLRLDAGEGAERPLVVSDGSWKIVSHWRPRLLAPRTPVARGEPPRVWGPVPTGSWGDPAVGPERPLFGTSLAGRRPVPPESSRPIRRTVTPDGHWTLWDWGREVEGYVEVNLPRGAPRMALLYASVEPPEIHPLRAAGALLAPPGAPAWSDAVLRRFRYAALIGDGEAGGISVWPVRPEPAASLASLPPPGGLLGLHPAPRPSPVAQRVWNRARGTP